MIARLRTRFSCYRVSSACGFWKQFYSISSTWNSKSSQPESFTKGLFLGNFNADIFTWPEMTCEVYRLEKKLSLLDLFFREQVPSVAIDRKEMVPKKILEELKNLNMFGLKVPSQYGGLELNMREYCAFREVTSIDRSIDEVLFSHELLGLQGLLIAGSEKQKEKYLSKLVKDGWIAALAVLESDLEFDTAKIKTRATMSQDGQTWNIRGKKKWVVNASVANMYTVLALTKETDCSGKEKNCYTAFLVQKDFGNIKVGEPELKIGLRGVHVCEVTFEDTVVPCENVLGEVGSGLEFVKTIYNSARICTGFPTAGVLSKLLSMGTSFEISRRNQVLVPGLFNISLRKLGDATCMIYAMESVNYMTAAIMDSQQYADYSIESAIVKIFSSENLWRTLHDLQEVVGTTSFDECFAFASIFRDCYTVLFPDESTEYLKSWIAIAGLQHAGLEIQKKVKKERNILTYPSYFIHVLFKKPGTDNSTCSSELESHLHKSLAECAKQLKSCIIILRTVSEILLTGYGAEIVHEQLLLIKLADIALCIYTMTAVLGRVSHSLNNTLQNSDYEISIVEMICSAATKKVKFIEMQIIGHHLETADVAYKNIAENLLLKKEYFPSHPLDRNF